VSRLCSLEPTRLFRLAAASIHQKLRDRISKTLRRLDTRNWQARFDDVHSQLRKLEDKLTRGRKQRQLEQSLR
jgi:hypothetical protein